MIVELFFMFYDNLTIQRMNRNIAWAYYYHVNKYIIKLLIVLVFRHNSAENVR